MRGCVEFGIVAGHVVHRYTVGVGVGLGGLIRWVEKVN